MTNSGGREDKIACLEEIAFRNNWIELDRLRDQGRRFATTAYGQYLSELVEELEIDELAEDFC